MLIIKKKDKTEQAVLICPFIESFEDLALKLGNYDDCSIVVYNTKDNFENLYKNWDKFSNFKRHFNIQFINPFSQTEKRWAIFPYTHNLVTEKSCLKLGLKSLFNTVEITKKTELEKVLK